ncbi:hypothetical protein PspLS_05212 [Pyricularia sp. CBS 133598]|nr:hypothetical protein PspLS_05212 [Pyricularia sp. CBS 133598]
MICHLPLHRAVQKSDLEAARHLLDIGVSTGTRDDAGNTAVHIAAAQGTTEMMELLAPLSPLSLRNKYGHTALYIAAVKGPRSSHVKLLLPHMRREVLLARHRSESFAEGWAVSEEEREGGVSVLLAATRRPRQVWMGEAPGDVARIVSLLIDAIGCGVDPREAEENFRGAPQVRTYGLGGQTAWVPWRSHRPGTDL